MAAANPNTVVVINAGSPVTMPWLDDVAAVLQVWFPGEEFGAALAAMLFGEAEPGGRLPITIPRRLQDTPAFGFYPGVNDHMPYGEGLLIGHRWYDAHGTEPAFPFGFGLGYTTWEMAPGATLVGDIATGVTVTVPVRNTGTRSGRTVVQVYVEPFDAAPGRPRRTLQGFAQVVAPAGGLASATIHLDSRAFSQWSPTTHRWVVVPGEYRLVAGFSSRDLTPVGASRAPGPV